MTKNHDFETDVLIVGTGPAGASASALLATHGIPNILINKYGWTAPTPRAHITNQRTLEVLRDLGIEDECKALAVPSDLMGENTYCQSLAGREFGRLRTWGTHPRRRADYELASPTQMCDLPQNLLEPVLVGTAAHRGAKVRFHTEFLSFEQDDEGVTSRVRDRMSGQEHTVRARYLLGADGANSRVAEQAKLPLEGKMGVSGSMNIVFEADLSKYVAHRPSVLYWVIQPGSEVGGLGIGVVRMVRPWNKWLAIWGYDIEHGPPEIDDAFAVRILHRLIGDDDVPITIESTSTWTVNDMFATKLKNQRVFALGDAVHRHPPTNGLGSNVSIQDAFNLAWKLAYVLKGWAGPTLLESYDEERAPIAAETVKRANKSLGDFPPILKALGLFDAQDPEGMIRNMNRLQEEGPEAEQQRSALREAIASSDYVYNCHGVEMNQRYTSCAVVSDGTDDPGFRRDRELYYDPSTRPGARLPHVWLTRGRERVSTLDLCGGSGFSLITGITGESTWTEAAHRTEAALGISITVHVIGPGRTYEDTYGDFARVREVEESGALLMRPDHHIAFRARTASAGAITDLTRALAAVLDRSEKAATRVA